MKKIVGIIAAAALATSAFAEISISSWNRKTFEPLHYDGDTLRSFSGAGWGMGDGNAGRSGLSFSASTENAGIAIDINAENGVSTGDNALVWVKPVDMLTVKFGQINNNWGRLDHCFGTWGLSRFGLGDAYYGEGIGGIGRKNGEGVNVSLQPVEGFVIDYEANFGGSTATYAFDPTSGGSTKTVTYSNNHAYEVMWENSSTMIGYQADFGFIRAIINGEAPVKYSVKDDDKKPAATIAVAADITAVENLTLKFGVKLPTFLKTENSYVNAVVGADYTLDALSLHANAVLNVLPKKVNDDGDVELGNIGATFGAGIDYAFNDVFTLVTDVRFKTWTNDNSAAVKAGTTDEIKLEDPGFAAYLGLKQQLTNAAFNFGVEFGKRLMANQATGKDEFTFSVPMTIEVSF